MQKSPTIDLYTWLSSGFDHFNNRLFDGTLAKPILTVQREKKTMGYFSANRWANSTGDTVHEIAINPGYFAGHKFIEIMQTLVHEMCHMWQHGFGTPSRAGYHNKEWADKMTSIGLIPSSTGAPGGARTGQSIADYPASEGLFINACAELVKKGYELKWIDRHPAISSPCQIRRIDIDNSTAKQDDSDVVELLNCQADEIISDIENVTELEAVASKKRKLKYTCNGCQANVWGKPGLKLDCGLCTGKYYPED